MTTQTFPTQSSDVITVTYWTLRDGTTVYAEVGPTYAVLKYWRINASDGSAIRVAAAQSVTKRNTSR